MTYDRKVIKVPEQQLRAASQKMYDAANAVIFR